MRSTYRTLQETGAARSHASGPRRHGLTDPSVIEAYVNRRLSDPSLLSSQTGPSYADFFSAPAA